MGGYQTIQVSSFSVPKYPKLGQSALAKTDCIRKIACVLTTKRAMNTSETACLIKRSRHNEIFLRVKLQHAQSQRVPSWPKKLTLI